MPPSSHRRGSLSYSGQRRHSISPSRSRVTRHRSMSYSGQRRGSTSSSQTRTTFDYQNDPYQWGNRTGWKRFRTLNPFRGMYCDVRRRLPYYRKDITDGFNYRTIAGTVRIFFVNLLPALAFTLDMTSRTGGYFGINESLFASALAALVFSTLSCQPLTVVGITGLIALMNYTVYDIAKAQGIVHLYPEFIAWVSIWAAITHWMASVFNWCDYMRFITDFSSQSFGMYVGIIYMIKGVELLAYQFNNSTLSAGYLSVVIALLYWFSIMCLEGTGRTIYGRPWLRKLLSDYAYPIATIWWTGFSHIPGRLAQTALLRVPHTTAFYPTTNRLWIVHFWDLPVKWIFVALPIGILLTLLFYYDHNVSSLTAQAKQFPLTKPAGFHWDFFLLGCTCFIGGVVGIPLPNGLVPQAPVHTDSCTEYQDIFRSSKEKDDTPGAEEIVHHKKIIEAVDVKEQRVSHFLMALALIGTMTGPLLDVLHTIPQALFAGVFFVVGFGSCGFNNGIVENALYIFREKSFVDPGDPRTTLRKPRIALYIMFQALGIGFSVAISQTIAAIGFPVIIVSLIPLRWCILPRIFTEHELLVLDDPTANAEVVPASMGGRPTLPEVALAEKKRQETRAADGGEQGVSTSSSESANKFHEGMRSRDGFRDAEEEAVEEEKEEREEREGIRPTLDTGHA